MQIFCVLKRSYGGNFPHDYDRNLGNFRNAIMWLGFSTIQHHNGNSSQENGETEASYSYCQLAVLS